eukprot:312318_1
MIPGLIRNLSCLIGAYCTYKVFTNDSDFTTSVSNINKTYFDNRCIWLTGASSGIGKSIAFHIASIKPKNCTLIISARRENKLNDIKNNILNKVYSNITIIILPIDLSKKSENYYESKFQLIPKSVDILINNAGIGQYAVCWQIDFKHINDIIQTNLISPICLTQLVLRNKLLDKTNHFAHIVNISSGSSMFHPATMSSYSATKSGLSSFSRSIREEFRIANQQNDNLFDFHVSDFIVGSVKDTEVMIKAKSVHGITYNKQLDHVDNSGMTPQRCAELILIGISNQRHEVWTAKQPELIVFYLMHYFKGFTSGVLHYLTADKLFETYPHQMSKL